MKKKLAVLGVAGLAAAGVGGVTAAIASADSTPPSDSTINISVNLAPVGSIADTLVGPNGLRIVVLPDDGSLLFIGPRR